MVYTSYNYVLRLVHWWDVMNIIWLKPGAGNTNDWIAICLIPTLYHLLMYCEPAFNLSWRYRCCHTLLDNSVNGDLWILTWLDLLVAFITSRHAHVLFLFAAGRTQTSHFLGRRHLIPTGQFIHHQAGTHHWPWEIYNDFSVPFTMGIWRACKHYCWESISCKCSLRACSYFFLMFRKDLLYWK